MAIGIDPLVDFAAKRVLGSPEHSRITLHFLELGAANLTPEEVYHCLPDPVFAEATSEGKPPSMKSC